MPGSFFKVFTSFVITAKANLEGVIFESIVIADFAPIPPTEISSSNVCSSSFELNPNKLMSSSLTFKYV